MSGNPFHALFLFPHGDVRGVTGVRDEHEIGLV
jgi:hypothetical protein